MTFYVLFACLLLFCLPTPKSEMIGKWQVCFPSNGKMGISLSLKKRVNGNCPGWLSITSKINLRESSCSWDIDYSFSSWARVYLRSLSTISKREGKGMEVRSYTVSFSSLESLCSGWVSALSLVGNWGHHLEILDPKNDLFRGFYIL